MAGVNYSINVASGTTRIHGGKFGVPNWTDTTVGTVAAIPTTNVMSDVEPVPSPLGTGDSFAVVAAWGGGALGYIGDDLFYLVHGGGHQDYGGNEIYQLNLFRETPTWELWVGATANADITLGAMYYADGRPNISHTRDTLTMLDGVFWKIFQSGVYNTINSSYNVNSYDSVNGWSGSGDYTDVPAASGSGIRGSVVADETRKIIWIMRDGTAQKFASYDPATGTHTTYAATYYTGIETNAAISASRDEILLIEGTTYLLFDLTSPNTSPTSLSTTGTPSTANSPGVVWDEGRGRWVTMGASRNQVHELDPATLVWSTRTFTGIYDATPSDSNGINSRFKYVPEFSGYVYLGHADHAAHFYRSH